MCISDAEGNMQEECVADGMWKAVTDGMWYVLVPVKERERGSMARMHDDQGTEVDATEAEPQAELDTESLASSSLFSLVRFMVVF